MVAEIPQKPEILVLDADTMAVNSRLTDYESFSWTHNWYGIDEWTIKINRYKNGVDLLDEEGYIAYVNLEGDWSVGIIGKITKPGGADGRASEQWEIAGIGIEGIFNHRNCMNDYSNSTTAGYTVLQSMSIETAMRQIVNQECIAATNSKRDLTGLSLAATDSGRPSSKAVLDLRFSGSNGSTVIKDSSKYNHAITAYGSAAISTAQYKFNSSSLYIPGTSGSYLTSPDSDDWDFGSGSFAICGWIYPTDFSSYHIIILKQGALNTYGPWEVYTDANKLSFVVSTNGTSWAVVIVGTTALAANTWYYFAVINDQSLPSNQIKLYLNGSLEGQATFSGTLVPSSNPLCVGALSLYSTQYNFKGYLADIVIKKGEAIDGTIVPTSQFVDPLVAEKSVRTDTVASVLEDLSRQSGVSYRLTWTGTANGLTNRKLFQFDVLEGTNLSTGNNAVKLSVEFGNLLTYEYVRSVLEKKNFLFIGGSGDGASRILAPAYTGDTEPSGWSRRESFYDSSDSTTAAQAQSAGIAQLGTLGDTQTLTFTYNYLSNSYKYGRDFNLGDIVVAQVADVAAITARITQVVESYDANGKSIELTMGTSSVDLVSILKAQIRAVKKLGAH